MDLLQALPVDGLCIFIKISLGKIHKANKEKNRNKQIKLKRTRDNTKPLICNTLLTTQGMMLHHLGGKLHSRSWAWV